MKHKLYNSINTNKFIDIEKPLDREEEFILIKRWQDNNDEKALNRILGAYKRLVNSIARKFSGYGLPKEDLFNEGILGIMYALNKFDTSKGFRLSTYARWWIRATMQDYILKNWSIVRTGSTAAQKMLFFNLNKLKKQINDSSSDFMGNKELNIVSKMLNAKSIEVQHMESRLAMGDRSLNQKINDNDNEDYMSLLKDERPTQDFLFEKEHDDDAKKTWLKIAIDQLKDREKIIITSRKLSENSKTLDVLGKDLNISKERVRQIENQALKKLRKNILKASNQSKEFFVKN